MTILFEIIPVLLFFIAFKCYDIYVATKVAIVTSAVQVVFSRLYFKKWDNKQLITLGIFVVFGGMTLYYHNPIFVKWKPTVAFWLFALVIACGHFFLRKNIVHYLMAHIIEEKAKVPEFVWSKLNVAWFVFFSVLGSVNLYVAYYYDSNVWVNFKLYGVTSALMLFGVVQTLYLFRYLPETPHDK